MELSFGQRIDPQSGLVECWFTHGALDEIKAMDLSDRNILVFGAGLGDAWLARRCKKLVVVERNQEWLMKAADICAMNAVNNVEYLHRPCNDCSGKDEYYLAIPKGFEPDIIINDDAYRYEACVMAVEYFKKKEGGGILIVDNWQQDFVFMCPAAEEVVKGYEIHKHIQADHTDHEGHPWQTVLIFIK